MIGYLVEYEDMQEEFDGLDDAIAFAELHSGAVYAVTYEEVDRELVLAFPVVDRSTTTQEE